MKPMDNLTIKNVYYDPEPLVAISENCPSIPNFLEKPLRYHRPVTIGDKHRNEIRHPRVNRNQYY